MIVELEKNMVTGMLTVLGKLVNRNAADKSYLALRLAAENGTLKLSTRSSTEQLTYTATIPEKEAFTAFVPMDAFRDAVRSCKKRSVSILYTEDVLTVSDVQIPLMEMDWPVEKEHSSAYRSVHCPDDHQGNESVSDSGNGDHRGMDHWDDTEFHPIPRMAVSGDLGAGDADRRWSCRSRGCVGAGKEGGCLRERGRGLRGRK